MLYYCFRISVAFSAILGLIHMIAEGTFIYVFFPIAIIIWAIYSFFDENDKEYFRRNGIDPEEASWFSSEYDDYNHIEHICTYNNHESDNRRSYPARVYRNYDTDAQYARYAPKGQYKDALTYKTLKNKCKRNFKITIDK